MDIGMDFGSIFYLYLYNITGSMISELSASGAGGAAPPYLIDPFSGWRTVAGTRLAALKIKAYSNKKHVESRENKF